MLSQIVKPLVQTQIRLLANSQATRLTLIETIARWLGYLGVHAQVTHLAPDNDKIQVALTVSKPESCDRLDWQQIITNLSSSVAKSNSNGQVSISKSQEMKLQRLLAYLIQIANPNQEVKWEEIKPELEELELDEKRILGIRSALKVPQDLEGLIKGIEPDVAAIALPIAVKIALLDQQINSEENLTLAALFEAMK